MVDSSHKLQVPASPSSNVSPSPHLPTPTSALALPDRARIIVAPASFKGSLSALEAAEAMARGIHDVLPHARTALVPLSDGGEGLVAVLAPALGATVRASKVRGPLPGQNVDAHWAMTPDMTTAIIEMASAAGLSLVPETQRDPRITTTYGVGELIRAAIDAGATDVLLGLGGSATNDGGTGMARALGYGFLDARGCPVAEGGAGLSELHRIDLSQRDRRLDRLRVTAACDVSNPFFGPEGATRVYAPQKGGMPEFLNALDLGMQHLSELMKRDCGCDVTLTPGSGAAGGLGGGVMAFLHGRLTKGIDIVLDALRFDDSLRGASIVITGEGCLDAQTRQGKAMQGVVTRASNAGVPVLAVTGTVSVSSNNPLKLFGLADLETLTDPETTKAEAMRDAAPLLRARTAALLKRHLPS